MKIKFNRGNCIFGNQIKKPDENEIATTPTLRQASLELAVRYGGTLTRKAIEAMDITPQRKYLVVDTKVHFLMPGWCPSIPGWHTDGVPRGENKHPADKGEPDILFQHKSPETESSIYHLLIAGNSSATKFIYKRDLELEVSKKPIL